MQIHFWAIKFQLGKSSFLEYLLNVETPDWLQITSYDCTRNLWRNASREENFNLKFNSIEEDVTPEFM